MDEVSNVTEQSTKGGGMFERYLALFGPQAFGVATVLVLYFGFFKPQMDNYRLDFSRNEKLVDTFRESIAEHREAITGFQTTTLRFEAAVERICRAIEKNPS
jgi:hypothetical protein